MKVMLRPADGTLFPLLADFCNKIGTLLPSANAAACPQLADADIRVLNEESGFDPGADLGP